MLRMISPRVRTPRFLSFTHKMSLFNKLPDELDALVESYAKLDLNDLSRSNARSSNPKPLLFQFRQYSTYSYTDHDHLDEKGCIKRCVLEQRRDFLQKHNMLCDPFEYLGRPVYANRHLYDLDSLDPFGRSNRQRMQLGYAPMSRAGRVLVVLHHFDQRHDGPWVVLEDSFHKAHHKELHSDVVLIHGVKRSQFGRERQAFWKYESLIRVQEEPSLKRRM